MAASATAIGSFPLMLSLELAIRDAGANRIARRAEPLIAAIAGYESAHGQIESLGNLKRAGYLQSLPRPEVRGAGGYELESYAVGERQLSVIVPVRWHLRCQ